MRRRSGATPSSSALPSIFAFADVAASSAWAGVIPSRVIQTSSRTFVPWANTPTSLPQPMVTPSASALRKPRSAICMDSVESDCPGTSPRKYSLIASGAASVGRKATPFSRISANVSREPPYPCSIVCTPAEAARCIASSVIACTATGRPRSCATDTAARSSSSQNVGRISPAGPVR